MMFAGAVVGTVVTLNPVGGLIGAGVGAGAGAGVGGGRSMQHTTV